MVLDQDDNLFLLSYILITCLVDNVWTGLGEVAF